MCAHFTPCAHPRDASSLLLLLAVVAKHYISIVLLSLDKHAEMVLAIDTRTREQRSRIDGQDHLPLAR